MWRMCISFKSMEEQASIKKAQVEELAQRNHLKLRVGDVLTAKKYDTL